VISRKAWSKFYCSWLYKKKSHDKIATRARRPGEIIFREGAPGTDVYLNISASVEIYKTTKRGRQLINRLSGDEIFGAMSGLINNTMPIIKPVSKQLAPRLKKTRSMRQQSCNESSCLTTNF